MTESGVLLPAAKRGAVSFSGQIAGVLRNMPRYNRGYMHIRAALAFVPVPLLFLTAVLVAQKQPLDVQALMQLARISDPQISPDGRWVAFTAQTVDVAKNTKPKQIY